jgi:glycosyltransferase involved in cell wall biosynthesis
MTRIPYSFTAHAMDIYKTHIQRKTIARKIRHADFVVTVSDFNKRFLESIAPECSEKIVKVHNGIHMDLFREITVPVEGPFTFLCVARFVEKKGHAVLLKACRRLQQRGIDFRCLLAGAGRFERDIDDQIREYRLQNCVRILGALNQNEVLKSYRNSQAFVLPCIVGADGNRDGLPVSIVEALACGLPVVTTPMTGIPEVVRHQQNGLLVPSNDADALAAAMEKLVHDADLFHHLKKNTRDSVEREFDFERTISRLLMLFEKNVPVESSANVSDPLPSEDGVFHHV